MACVTVSAFSRGLLDANKAAEVMSTLRNLAEESQQVSKMFPFNVETQTLIDVKICV